MMARRWRRLRERQASAVEWARSQGLRAWPLRRAPAEPGQWCGVVDLLSLRFRERVLVAEARVNWFADGCRYIGHVEAPISVLRSGPAARTLIAAAFTLGRVAVERRARGLPLRVVEAPAAEDVSRADVARRETGQ